MKITLKDLILKGGSALILLIGIEFVTMDVIKIDHLSRILTISGVFLLFFVWALQDGDKVGIIALLSTLFGGLGISALALAFGEAKHGIQLFLYMCVVGFGTLFAIIKTSQGNNSRILFLGIFAALQSLAGVIVSTFFF